MAITLEQIQYEESNFEKGLKKWGIVTGTAGLLTTALSQPLGSAALGAVGSAGIASAAVLGGVYYINREGRKMRKSFTNKDGTFKSENGTLRAMKGGSLKQAA